VLLKTELSSVDTVTSFLFSSASVSSTHGLVSVSKKTLCLNYKLCIFHVQSQTTDSSMAPKVIQVMHKQNSACWVLLLRLLPLSCLCHESNSNYSRSTCHLNNKIFPPAPGCNMQQLERDSCLCWLFFVKYLDIHFYTLNNFV